MNRYDTIIIGAGLAGLATACQLACLGQKVLLIGQGHGSLLLASGCIDVLGFQPVTSKKPVRNPLSQLADFIREHPDHPYHFTGIDTLEAGLKAFQALVNHSKLPYQGIIKNNWFLPSPAGVIHPTCLAPLSLANGELSGRGHMLIVGFYQLRDFYPGLISQNLTQQDLGFPVEALTVELPSMPIADDHNVTPVELALMFEQPDFRQQVINRLKNRSKGFHRIGFPAVLGLKEHTAVIVDMQNQLNSTVFEISTLPPSVPGRRLLETLRQVLVDAGGHIIIGSRVIDGVIENGRATQIRFETASRPKTIKAANFVLATGGIYGGGIQTDAEGGLGRVWEPIFGLPVAAESNRHLWFAQNFLDPKGQPFANFGVRVNNRLNPVDEANTPIADNLYIAGATIAGADWTRGRTGEGVALATAAAIVKRITGRIYDDGSSPA
jgi:glycerol-3-phosphate dehydrogenase subunit B